MTSSLDASVTAGDTAAPGARRWWALALICLAQFMLILDVTVVNIALPSIDAELHFGGSLGWVIAGYSLPFGVLLIAGGVLAGRIGLRTAFLIGLGIFTLASLGAATAATGGALIGFRIGQGIGAALLSPAALALVLSLFAGPARNRALAVWAGIGGAGAAIGSVVGGALTQAGGWRWVFLVNVPVGIAVAVLVSVVLRASLLAHPDRPATGALLRTLRSATVGAGAVTMLLASMLLVGSFFVLSIALQDAAHLSPLFAGLAFLPAAVGVGLGAQVGAHLLGRFAPRAIGAAGFAVVGIGFAIAWMQPHSVAALISGVAVAALGLGPVLVTSTATATSRVAPEDAGAASGVVNTVHEAGGGIGVLIASVPALVAATASGSSAVFGLAAGGAVVATLVAAFVLPSGRVQATGGMHH